MSEPTTIRVYCDDPRHARGKVAEIDTFTKFEHGWITNEQLADRKPRDHGWMAGRSKWGAPQHEYRCKLCGLSLACSPQLLNQMLDRIAGHGEPTVPLRALVLLASKSRFLKP